MAAGSDPARATPPGTASGPRLAAVWVLGVGAVLLRNGFRTTSAVAIDVGLAVLAAAIIALLEQAGRRPLRPLAAMGVALLAATAVLSLVGGAVYPAAATLVGTVVAYGAVVRWRLLPGWRQRVVPVAGLAVGPLVVAMVGWYRDPRALVFGGLLGASVVLLEVYARSPAFALGVGRAVELVGRAISVAITTIVATVAMVVVIIPVNLVSRLFGYSPLDPGWASRSTAWVEVDPHRVRRPNGEPAGPRSMAMLELAPSPRVRRRGHLRMAVPLVAVAAIAVAVWGNPLDRTSSGSTTTGRSGPKAPGTFTRPFEEDPAFADAPWAKDLRLDLLDAWNNLEFNAALGGWGIKDVAAEYINVRDGERATTAPDPNLGDPVTIWFFGGSAAFGAGQRDAHTIPSELVRRAGRDGVALEVHNFAVPATVNWQSMTLLLARLEWSSPPDLVVVYDGANDLALQDVLIRQGKGRSDRPASLIDAELDEILRERAEEKGSSSGVTLPPSATTTPQDPPDPEEEGRLVATRYRRGVEVIRRLCEQAGVPVAMFWQPELRLKTPLTDVDRRTLKAVNVGDGELARAQRYSRSARADLADIGVTDLTTVFDGRDDALYWDQVHTNEVGARVVADAVYGHLRPTLDQLRAGGG